MHFDLAIILQFLCNPANIPSDEDLIEATSSILKRYNNFISETQSDPVVIFYEDNIEFVDYVIATTRCIINRCKSLIGECYAMIRETLWGIFRNSPLLSLFCLVWLVSKHSQLLIMLSQLERLEVIHSWIFQV
jgi:hypothetical protein